MLTFSTAIAQNNDSVTILQREFITDQLENLAEMTDLNMDYSDLLDRLTYYQKNPIPINDKDQIDQLENLGLLNDIQINNIKRYRDQYGDILSPYELQFIDGFNQETIQRILPFVKFGKPGEKTSFSLKRAFKYGRHQVLFRYKQMLEKSAGYLLSPDSALSRPGTDYLGKPFKLYTRYTFSYQNHLHAGLTMEKDPGEVFWKNALNDSVLKVVGNKVTNIFDFYSAHLYIAGMGILKKAVVGDYHLEFGQGLNLWSGLGFGRSAQGVYVKRYGRGIRPNTSVNENRFFRGAAATIQIRDLEITGFYSNHHADANLPETDTLEQPYITTIQETGLHRTIHELLAKNAINIQTYGGHLKYHYKIFEIGATAYHTRLDKPLVPSDALYKKFAFSGDRETHYGADFSLVLNKVNFFGEFSLTENKAFAILAGMNAGFTDRLLFTLAYRNYSRDYHNFYGLAFGATQNGSNEEGIYLGFMAFLTKTFSLSGYVDHYRFPWLRYRSDFPSYGSDYVFQLNITPSRKVVMYVKYRHKQFQENYKSDYDYTPLTDDTKQDNIRFNITWNLSPSIIMKNRVEYVSYHPEYNEKSNGYLMYQDVLYRPYDLPLDITFRYALFSTDSWDSRIYAYENDVLYAFSIPAYYGRGQRVYLMARYKMNRRFTFWFRVARATWFDRNTIGSGADQVNGDHKTEIKAQVMIKL
jgi:hypothetical protein